MPTERTLLGGGAAFGHFFDGAELRLVARDILSEGAKDALGMAGADDHAFEQLALRAVGENIDKVQRKFLEIVVNHHEIAVLALQFLLVRLDLYLPLHRLLLVHRMSPSVLSLRCAHLEGTTAAAGAV